MLVSSDTWRQGLSASYIWQKQGRFEVYEGDMNMSPPVHDGAVLLDQHLGGNRLPELSTRYSF